VDVDAAIAAAQSSAASRKGTMSFIDFPDAKETFWTVWYQTGTRSDPELTKVAIAAADGTILSERVHGRDPMSWILKLHTELLVGSWGQTVVGLAGILLMVSIASGLFLWWPLWRHSWRAAFSLRTGMRQIYDLHKDLGIFVAPVLLVVAFTGVYLTFPKWIAPCVKLFSAESAVPSAKLHSTPLPGQIPLSVSQVVEIVAKNYPQAHVRRVHFPQSKTGAFIVRYWQPGDVNHQLGSSRVWIDVYRGSVLGSRDWRARTAADTFFAWQLPLHNGEALGTFGRCLVFLAGLAPLGLFATGGLLWLRKSRSRARQAHRP
jgi:uncharacterized iron-regulated membrane protein